MIKKILNFAFILIIFLTFSTNVKANSETFYSRTLLGRIADNSWQQAGAVSSTGNSITLSSDALSSYYPYWIGGYGNKSGNFETNKTYFLNFKINYPSTTQFDFKKAMQYAQMEIAITNVHVNLCTLESNTNTYSTFTCQFSVSSASSYYEFNVNWYNSNLYQLGFEPIYNYEKATLSIDFILSSQTDNSGLIVEQNEIIIGQNQQIIDTTNDVNNSINDLNDSINNSDTSNATNSAGNFFSGFETDTFGLTSIITAPLDLIGSITSSSCSPLPLTIPYVDKPFNLPCMTTIYETYFGNFLTIYQTITFGIVAYWVCVRIFNLVKDFKNPDHDEIEVVDL